MNSVRKVLQELIGAKILQIRIYSSNPAETLYGITITTTDGYVVSIGFPDVDENIIVYKGEHGGGGEVMGEEL